MIDYEKEFKKLKASIKNEYLFAQTNSTRAVLEKILPELVKPTTKDIVGAIRDEVLATHDGFYLFNGIPTDVILDWLKKQEEEERQWSEKDDTILNNIIWAVHMKSIKPLDEMDSRQKYVDYEEWLRKFKFKHKNRWNQNEWDMFRSIYTDVRNARQITVNSLDGDVKKQEEKRMEEVLDFLKSFCPKEECAEDF